jgi:hypothetical protein
VPQSRSGRGGEEKNSQPLSGPEPSIIQPLAQRYTTELSQQIGRSRAPPITTEFNRGFPQTLQNFQG